MEHPEWERFEDPLERYRNYISKKFGTDARSKAQVAMAQDRDRGRPYTGAAPMLTALLAGLK